jgi:hypothetical protein
MGYYVLALALFAGVADEEVLRSEPVRNFSTNFQEAALSPPRLRAALRAVHTVASIGTPADGRSRSSRARKPAIGRPRADLASPRVGKRLCSKRRTVISLEGRRCCPAGRVAALRRRQHESVAQRRSKSEATCPAQPAARFGVSPRLWGRGANGNDLPGVLPASGPE